MTDLFVLKKIKNSMKLVDFPELKRNNSNY